MPLFQDHSLRQKLGRITLIASGSALMLSGVALTVNEALVFRGSVLKELTTQTQIIGSNSTAALTFGDAGAATEILSALRANEDIDLARIYTREGALFAEYSPGGRGHDVPHPLSRAGHRFGLNEVGLYQDIVLDREVVGHIFLHSSLNALYESMLRNGGVYLVAFLVSMGAGYVFSTRLQMAITGEISALVHTMKTVSEEKDYSVRAAVPGEDELGALARGFNQMLVQIQERDDELAVHRKDLEALVEKRTGELKTANERLQGELTERKKAEDEVRRLNEDLEKKVEERSRALVAAQEELARQEKTARSQIVQSAKLAAIGELASGVAHELNQPLTVIRGTSQVLERRLKKGNLSLDEIPPHLAAVIRNTTRMMSIINHLRTFSRRAPESFEPVEINKVVESCFLLIGEQLKLRDIAVSLDLASGLPIVPGKSLELEQVILNLITNARDAIEEKRSLDAGAGDGAGPERPRGELTITTASVRVQGVDYVDILVRDTGCGIPEEHGDRIFEPFFTTKEVGAGTGLGLSISYGIVKSHQGEIAVAATGPAGTTIRVRLPAAGDSA